MKKVALLLANGFEEGEALFVVDILRRGNIICDIISIEEEMVTGSHQITVKADKLLKEVQKEDYDMLVLPGGQPGADNLRDNSEVIKWIQNFNQKTKWIAAICAAPQVLEKAGITKNKKITSYPSDKYKEILKESNYIDDELVVVDENLITSRGPATTLPFAYKLLEVLGGNVLELKKAMLYQLLEESIKNR